MANEDIKKRYEHYVPPVKEDPLWFNKLTLHVVESLEELKEIFDTHEGYMAWDTETEGLNPEKHRIVGYSIAFDHKEGWYVPIRHKLGKNLDPKEALDMLYNKMLHIKMLFAFNYDFDARMMEYEGYDLSPVPYYDVRVGTFMADTNVKNGVGLKDCEKRWLGWSATHFEEALGNAENFAYTDPYGEAGQYACVDACGTFAVCMKTLQYYKESKMAGKALNEFIYPMMRAMNHKIPIDVDYLSKCEEETIAHLKEIEYEVMQIVGYPFKINSNKQLGDALQSIGVNTGVFTKGGQMKVDIATLETFNLKQPTPIIEKLIDYSKSFKMYNSYITTLREQAMEKEDRSLRFAFKLFLAPTLRVAAGTDKNNDFFAKINVMAIPKPHPKNWYVHPYKEGDEVPEGDEVVLNWRFSTTEKSKYMTEGTDQHLNMRSAFLPEDGRYIVGMDFKAQELRCMANVANVKVWVDTFLSDGDLHENMAKAMWGEENYDKEKRKRAKVLNFGLLYGMSAYTLAERFHISLDEAEDIMRRYWNAVPEIVAYQNAWLRRAKKEGTIHTWWGAPRRLKHWLTSGDPKDFAFARRTVGNNQIQGFCSTLTQIAFIKVYKALYSNPDWVDYCDFFSYIHDEILSTVDKDKVLDFIEVQKKCMTMTLPNMPVPFETSVAIGNRWGCMFEFKYTEEGIEPDMFEVEE